MKAHNASRVASAGAGQAPEAPTTAPPSLDELAKRIYTGYVPVVVKTVSFGFGGNYGPVHFFAVARTKHGNAYICYISPRLRALWLRTNAIIHEGLIGTISETSLQRTVRDDYKVLERLKEYTDLNFYMGAAVKKEIIKAYDIVLRDDVVAIAHIDKRKPRENWRTRRTLLLLKPNRPRRPLAKLVIAYGRGKFTGSGAVERVDASYPCKLLLADASVSNGGTHWMELNIYLCPLKPVKVWQYHVGAGGRDMSWYVEI